MLSRVVDIKFTNKTNKERVLQLPCCSLVECAGTLSRHFHAATKCPVTAVTYGALVRTIPTKE